MQEQPQSREGKKGLSLGCGKLMMGLVYHAAQQAPDALPIDVVTTSGSESGKERVSALASQESFEVRISGLEDGRPVNRADRVSIINQGFDASVDAEWEQVLQGMRNGTYAYITSNVAESFLAPEPADAMPEGAMAQSHIGRTVQLLHAGFLGNQEETISVIPVELVGERNGEELKEAVRKQAEEWELGDAFLDYIDRTPFAVTLPDRIVSQGETSPQVWVGCEPFSELYIEKQEGLYMPWEGASAIQMVDDIQEPQDRKKGLLNVLHSAMVHQWISGGREPADLDVETMMRENADWVDGIFEEIIQVVEKLVPNPDMQVRAFASGVKDRFMNPDLDHKLDDIAAKHDFKIDDRLRWLQAHGKVHDISTPMLDALLENAIGKSRTEAGKAAYDRTIEEKLNHVPLGLHPAQSAVMAHQLKNLTQSGSSENQERGRGDALDASVTHEAFRENAAALLESVHGEGYVVRTAVRDAVDAYAAEVGVSRNAGMGSVAA